MSIRAFLRFRFSTFIGFFGALAS